MATIRVCDQCRQEITDDNPIIFKLFLTPVLPGKTRQHATLYTASMMIGQCCAPDFLKMHWTKRQSVREYHHARKLRAGNALENGNGAKKVKASGAKKR